MLIEPEITGCSIVMLGDFNPAIFQPSWLEAHGIEPNIVEADSNIEVIHRDITRFRIETRNYSIEPERFSLATTTAPWIAIADSTRHIFGELLTHTPVRSFGINRDIHFKLKDAATRVRLGRMLAPVEPWGAFGSELDSDDPDLIGGLHSLTMRRRSETSDARVDTNVKIEPSSQIVDQSGIFMQINFHHSLKDLESGHGALEAIQLLSSRFEECLFEAESVIETIMKVN